MNPLTPPVPADPPPPTTLDEIRRQLGWGLIPGALANAD